MSFKIKDICQINKDSLSKKDDFEYINYLDTGNLTLGNIGELQKLVVGEDKIPSRAKRKVKINDILISTVRPNQRHYGILKKIEKNMVVSTGFTVLSANEKIVDPSYLYNYLTQNDITEKLQAIAETSTTAYPSIKPSDIGNLDIELPPIEEQKAIAKILSDLDNKIEVNNKINKRLEEMAQSIFKHWFVDFEFPNEDGQPYKSSGGEIVDSELGMIPKGWEVVELGNIVSFSQGIQVPIKKQYKDCLDGFTRFLRIVDYTTNDTEEYRYIEEKNDRYLINKKEVAIVRYGSSAGFICRRLEGIIANNIFKINPITFISHNFLYYLLKRNEIQDYIMSSSIGSAMPALNHGIIGSIKTVIPNKYIADKYEKICDSFEEKIYENNKINKQLIILRDTLLPKLMSGEIRVPLD